MNTTLLVLRVLHVVGAVFWAGAILFVVHFLEPAVRDLGPDGGKVMQALQRRRYLEIVPVAALVTVLSGLWLYHRDFGRFHPGPGAPGSEITYGIGGLAALVALLVGVSGLRPTALRIGRLGSELAAAPPERRADLTAGIDAARRRLRVLGRVVVLLLTVAMVTMAVGRYV
jgi:uncharacterized membrane protein